MNKTLDIPMYQRSDIAENWESKNPTLGKAEFGYDETNKKMKLGDGITPWNDLPWYNKNFNIVNGKAKRSLHTIGSPENRQHIYDELGWVANDDYDEDDIEYTMGEYAFAEGILTKASGIASHAEGLNTTASGTDSHAEGRYTTAEGCGSHAEGLDTIASADYSHSEGYDTTAEGYCSHAEGCDTTASGHSSHAEGYKTIATGKYQHVQGKFNIEDTKGEYAHIVGNGTSEEKKNRSNAHTLDWDGNAWYAGKLTLEGDLTVKGAIRGSTPDGVVISSNNSNIVNGEAKRSLHTIGSPENRQHIFDELGWSPDFEYDEDDIEYTMGEYAFAEGIVTKASGEASHSEGYETTAYGDYSHAEGDSTTAKGYASHAEGVNSHASGDCSHAEGYETIASSEASHAEGYNTTASGGWSHAEGFGTTASGDYSHASGFGTIASNSFQYVIGKYNSTLNNGLFVIGNGSNYLDSSRSNAFRVTESGETYAMGSYNSTGADYSEYFEWSDGNPDNEIRTGRFVTMTGKKIKLATSIDDYIVGVVTANASIVGNSYEDSWNGRFMTDVYGNLLYEDKTDDEGNVTTWFKQNPDYDSSQKYIPRSQRPEWSTVGMLGQLVVDDDGTCEVDGYCKPNDNGVATKSEIGYRVIDRIDDTHILIIFK